MLADCARGPGQTRGASNCLAGHPTRGGPASQRHAMPKVQAQRVPTNPLFTVVLLEWDQEELRRNKTSAPTLARSQDLLVLNTRVPAAKPVASTLRDLNTALGTPRDGLKWPTAEQLMRCAGCFKQMPDGQAAYFATSLLQNGHTAGVWQVREFPRIACVACCTSWHKAAPAIDLRPLQSINRVLSVLDAWGASLTSDRVALLDTLGERLTHAQPRAVFAELDRLQGAPAARGLLTAAIASGTTPVGQALSRMSTSVMLHRTLDGLCVDFESYLPNSCNYCERESPRLRRCGGCYVVQYCGTAHQELDWRRGHKDVCRAGLTEESLPSGTVLAEAPQFG